MKDLLYTSIRLCLLVLACARSLAFQFFSILEYKEDISSLGLAFKIVS